jgi:hypothetical protein
MRLYIPQTSKADWYFYMVGDLVFSRGEFFPGLMQFTADKSKILFAVQDRAFNVYPHVWQRLKTYRRDYPGDLYYGSGFLFWRGGEALLRELRVTLNYFVQHMELEYIEQDALNLAFNTSLVYFLPHKFCVVPAEIDEARHWAYGFHHAAELKSLTGGFGVELMKVYEPAKQQWLNNHRLGYNTTVT